MNAPPILVRMEEHAQIALQTLHAVAQLSTQAFIVNKGFGAPQTHVKMEEPALKKWIISRATVLPSLLEILVVPSNQTSANRTHAKITEHASKTLTTSHATAHISTPELFVKRVSGASQIHV